MKISKEKIAVMILLVILVLAWTDFVVAGWMLVIGIFVGYLLTTLKQEDNEAL